MSEIKSENIFSGGEKKPKNLSVSILCDYYGSMLTKRQRELIEYYYNEDYSLTEISELTGITRQGVWRAVKSAENKLKFFEKKLGFLRLTKNIEDEISQIEIIAEKASSSEILKLNRDDLRDFVRSVGTELYDISEIIKKIL